MNLFAKYIRSLIIFLSSIIVIPAFLTIFNLFNLSTSRLVIIIFGALIMLISGFIVGKHSLSKGYLNGLLISVISIFILCILSLIFSIKLNINSLIYYVILVIATIIGSILGINKKSKK